MKITIEDLYNENKNKSRELLSQFKNRNQKQFNQIWDLISILYSVSNTMRRLCSTKISFEINNPVDEKNIELIDRWHKKNILFEALLRDYLEYVIPSITLLEDLNIKVSLATLRRPLSDNLLYIEWLLADENEFMNNILNGDIRKIDLNFGRNSKYNIKDKKSIIKSAIEKIKIDDNILTKNSITVDFMYDVRYNSNVEYSLDKVWNRGLHLITTHHNYKVNNGELNFIFTTFESLVEYAEFIIPKIIIILYYTICLSESIMDSIAKISEHKKNINRVIRDSILISQAQFRSKDINEIDILEHNMKCKYGDVLCPCEKCSKDILLTKKNLENIYYKRMVICNECKHSNKVNNIYL